MSISLRTSLDRVRARLGRRPADEAGGGTFAGLDVARWLVENTRSPRHRERSFSFDDHEFQQEILAARPSTVVRKPAQVGLSECSVRMALALAVLRPATHTIYALPTSRFANKFSASRVDPVVEASPSLSLMKSRETWSNELKRLGDSFVHFSGTFGQAQAISVPATTLIKDEVDFCDQAVLKSYASRLGHAGDEAVEVAFSTPTVPGYGISAMYEEGSQAVRMVFHEACSSWVVLDLVESLVLDGFDAPVTSLTADVLQMYPAATARLLCPACRREVTQANLADPVKRAWVDHYPDREVRSFSVSPFDAPHLNTPISVIARIGEYKRPGDWVGFGLGLPFENAEVAFLRSRIEAAPADVPSSGVGCVAGLDVGKVSWLVIAARRRDTGANVAMDVLHAEPISLPGEEARGGFVEAIAERMARFGVLKLVMDGLPDLLLVEQLKAKFAVGQVWSTFYVQGRKAGRLYTQDDASHVLSVDRTAWFDRLAQEVNAMRHGLVRGPEFEPMTDHLASMKRIVRGDRAVWISTGNAGDDHYAHAFSYARLAADQVWGGTAGSRAPVGVAMSKVRLPGRRAA